MADILKTNVCCFDLTQECLDYLKSLELNVYEGTLGSVFTINWGHQNYGTKPVLTDIDIPVNLHEYHVFIHDMENPHVREYKASDHYISHVESDSERHLECRYPVNTLDLRPFGTHRLANRFHDIARERRIEILFVGRENIVEYWSNVIRGVDPRKAGTYVSLDEWNLVTGKEKSGNRVLLEDNNISKMLFDGRLNNVNYLRVFTLPQEYDGDERIMDKHFMSLLSNESGECISYVYFYSEDYVKFVLPQVEDKAGLLKDLFERVIFRLLSSFFPDVEAREWIHNDFYQLPEEREVQLKIEAKRKEYEQEITKLEEEATVIRERTLPLKQLLTESGSTLVAAIKSFLEWLDFENVIDKDETLKEGELKEEDLCFDYGGNHIFMEVKGINGTSTDAECSQIDKIVSRRMRQLDSTNVHGVYVVNHQRNVEPLKRQLPPFNENQIKDAVSLSRTLVYTVQLFSLYSDVENGYITKEQAREHLLQEGLADFHSHLTSLGTPYDYYQDYTVICLDLHNTQVSVGDRLYYKDSLQRLVELRVESLQQVKKSLDTINNGKIGVKVNQKVPRNKEIFK